MPDISTLLEDTTPAQVHGPDPVELYRRGRRRRRAVRTAGAAGGLLAGILLLAGVASIARPPSGEGPQIGPLGEGRDAGPPTAWTQVTLDVGFGEACTQVGQRGCARLSDVVRAGDRFVVAGTDGRDPLVLSSQHGRDWDAVRLPVPDRAVGGWVNALAVGEDGRIVAVGGVDHGRSSGAAPAYARAAWYSADGRSWELAPAGPVEGLAYEITDVARYGGGFVATALEGGGGLATDLRLLTSQDGTSWQHGPILGGRLPALEQAPVVGVAAGPEVLVYAATGGACQPGLAVWRSAGKDGLPAGYGNSDDPARPAATAPSQGLADVVAVPCPTIEQVDADGETIGAWRQHAGAGVGVSWTGADPTIRSYLRADDDYAQHLFTTSGAAWVDTGPPAPGEPVDLVTAGMTDGYRMAWSAIDTPWSTDAGETRHAVGDGVGRGLEAWTNDGTGWTRADGRDTPGVGDRAGITDLSGVQILGGGCGEPDTAAIGAIAGALGTDRGVTVGIATSCLAQARPQPALWLGPLP